MWETYFFKNHAENVTGRLVPDLFLFFRKALSDEKAGGLHLSFNVSIAIDLDIQ